jgi:uncharacterized protein
MKTILYFLLYSIILVAQPKVPELKSWVTDLTGTLSSQELNNLNYELKTFEDSTSNQLVVLMIPALGNYPIDYYSMDVVNKNKIGTKQHDNGVLLLIVKNDKKMRIEVGYGLEGALPDALSSSIIRNVIAPYFRNDEYYKGIATGVNAIIAATKGEYKGVPKEEHHNRHDFSFILYLIFFIFFFVFPIFSRGGRRGRGGFIFFPGGFWGGGFGGGGSSGGGGFGGFSGGGGSFGGGGASGGW